ncbi:calcium-binding protein [Caulobacter flavus]|uniref:calcium-binding protein n=1 Tax=Caulobacter flavus TaxID=1679497 RepID=UPI0015DE4001|nr:calcium-binding protein [Caulobacter flavus]
MITIIPRNIIPAAALNSLANKYIKNQSFTTEDHYYNKMVAMGYSPTGPKGYKLDVGQKNNALSHTFAMAKISFNQSKDEAIAFGLFVESFEAGIALPGNFGKQVYHDKPLRSSEWEANATADLWNNQIGARLGEIARTKNLSAGSIDHLVRWAYNQGWLAVNPALRDGTYLSADFIVTARDNVSMGAFEADLAAALSSGSWQGSAFAQAKSNTLFGDDWTPDISIVQVGGYPLMALMSATIAIEVGDSPAVRREKYWQALSEFGAEVGSIVGASLGDFLAKGEKVKGIAYSSLLGEVGERLGGALLSGSMESAMRTATQGGLGAFGEQVAVRAGDATLGAVSSWLTMELGEALGLQGFGAELFTTVGSRVTSQVITNLLSDGPSAIFNAFQPQKTVNGVSNGGTSGAAMANALGSFIGAKLGAMVVSPQTQAGVALSSIGSAVGSFIAGKIIGQSAGMWLNLIAPGIGSFVGFVLGALIGNLFGKKKPKIPSATAETVLQLPYAQYELGAVTVANNGNRELVTSMASTARDTLNTLIDMVAYTKTTAYVSNLNGVGTTQIYGHTGNQIWVKINGAQNNFGSADAAVEYGTLTAIRNTKIVGGDIFAKRAIARSPSADITSLAADLQIAGDYRYYANNRDMVNGFITGAYNTLSQWEQNFYDHPPHKALIDKLYTQGIDALTTEERGFYDSYSTSIQNILKALKNQELANPWIVTLQRVTELGLDKFSASDFYGGLRGFLDSFDLAERGVAYENANFQWNGVDFSVSVAGGTQGLFSILPTAAGDGRTVTIDGLDKIAYTWVGAGGGTNGNDYMEYRWHGGAVTLDDTHAVYVEDGYYRWDGWDSYEWIDTSYWSNGDGGDDIFVGSQYGDQLYGRGGWDWLDGQAGDDYIEGGDGNDTLIGRDGNDSLFGGAGDDFLAGGDGGDTVHGGAGNDVLADGQGGEVLQGGDGDDTFLIAADATFNWFWGGDGDLNSDPNGRDTISAERLTFGVAFDLDFRPADWNGHPDGYANYAASRAAVVVNAATGAWVTSEGLVSIENATGSEYADRLYGTAGDNVIKGLAGDDQLYGREGNDILEGGAGADLLVGGGYFDTASYAGSAAGVQVDLSTGEAKGGDAAGDVLQEIENLRGSGAADELKGNFFHNRLEGLGGDDWLVATNGEDVYDGGEGLDFVDYSSGFASGTSTYQTWVEDGYWERDQWDNSQYWVSTGGHYETVTTTVAALNVNLAWGGQVRGSDGVASNHSFIGVEGIIGTAEADSIGGGNADETFVGGAGNDYLYGGAGADTYVMYRNDGADTIVEDNTGWNTLSFGDTVTFSELWFGTAGGANGWLDVGVRGYSAQARIGGNFAQRNNTKIKSLAVERGGAVDLGGVDFGRGGTDGADTINGTSSYYDLIAAYDGADYITGSGTAWEDKGNVIIAGRGDDTISTSGGDDQFAYDRGDGKDTIIDAGGEDTIVFGATVVADDVIYEVVGGDLYIAARDLENPDLVASQVNDRIRIQGGGVKYIVKDGYSDTVLYESLNTVEYVLAGGTSIDLRKLDITWAESVSYNQGYAYPIALDLDGDGLNLSAVDNSEVVVRTAGGGISRVGWVGPTDGFLAVDRDGDGAINRLSELSFVQDKPGAKSDLEGLRTWDTNGDGLLDKNDKDFSKILLFVDANQNGRSTAKELRTLEQAGIAAINLGGLATGQTRELTTESFVQHTISFVWADGRTGEGYDVALARRVLGSVGYAAGEYQAEWGRADEDGELGRLSNDPVVAAKTARVRAQKGLLDKLGATYAEIKAAAQLDFSDHDRVDASIAKRWAKMSASEQASWLTGQETTGKVRLISSEQALVNTVNDAAKARQKVVDKGYAQASATLSPSGLDQGSVGDAAKADILGLGVSFGVSGLGLSLAGGEPLETGPAYGGAEATAEAWWRQDEGASLLGGSSLGARLAAMDAEPGYGLGQIVSGAVNAELLQRQALLRQAMAGFGGQAGGGAAVWTRQDGGQDVPLAASAGLRAQSVLAA